MALASLFKSESRDLLERLEMRGWSSAEEKTAVCEQLAAATNVKTQDAVRLLLTPDGEIRRAAVRLLATKADPEALRLLLEAARGRPEAARRAALTLLADAIPGGVAREVVAIAESAGDPALRKVAVDALLDLPLTQEVVPSLSRIIETGEATHRLRAVMRFAEIATDRHVPFFERLLDDPDERLRHAAWQAVLKFAGPGQLELLLRKVPHEPYATQQLLIDAVRRILPEAGPEGVDRVLLLLSSGSTSLRSAALKILLSLPDRAATIRRFVTYSRELAGWVRDRALESLREFGDAVLEPALELGRDPDPQVRSAALTLAAGLKDARVGPLAASLLADPDWWLAISAAETLGRLGDQRAVPALVQALTREEVRWAAAEALGHVGGPAAIEALVGLTRDARAEIRIEALGALAACGDASVVPVLQASAEQDEVKWVRARAADLARKVAKERSAAVDEAALAAAAVTTRVAVGAPAIHALLALARREGASDLHVSVDSAPAIRLHGRLVRLSGEPLTPAQARALLTPLLSPAQALRLESEMQLDACFHVENDGRYRANLFLDRKGLNGVFRVIPDQPPTTAELELPEVMGEVTLYHQGLILVTGPAGCGKSTTLASLVNLINETRRAHVLTLEDPVEFVHPFKSSLVNQREVGSHTVSFARALRAALRENPDVIVIGEMRDAETVSLALTAAETGHVVFATLNATTAHKAVDRVISSFPADEQSQIRESFADSLKLVLAQALLPSASGTGRVACHEVLRATPAVANLIRDGKTFQIPSAIQLGQRHGMRTFDDSLLALLRAGRITPQTAWMRATSKDAFEPFVPPKFLEEIRA